jgi:hypothetical protein
LVRFPWSSMRSLLLIRSKYVLLIVFQFYARFSPCPLARVPLNVHCSAIFVCGACPLRVNAHLCLHFPVRFLSMTFIRHAQLISREHLQAHAGSETNCCKRLSRRCYSSCCGSVSFLSMFLSSRLTTQLASFCHDRPRLCSCRSLCSMEQCVHFGKKGVPHTVRSSRSFQTHQSHRLYRARRRGVDVLQHVRRRLICF